MNPVHSSASFFSSAVGDIRLPPDAPRLALSAADESPHSPWVKGSDQADLAERSPHSALPNQSQALPSNPLHVTPALPHLIAPSPRPQQSGPAVHFPPHSNVHTDVESPQPYIPRHPAPPLPESDIADTRAWMVFHPEIPPSKPHCEYLKYSKYQNTQSEQGRFPTPTHPATFPNLFQAPPSLANPERTYGRVGSFSLNLPQGYVKRPLFRNPASPPLSSSQPSDLHAFPCSFPREKNTPA